MKPTQQGSLDARTEMPRSDMERGSCALAPRGSQGSAGSRVPEPSLAALAAARGNGSHRSLVDPKERRFSEATIRCPLTRRTAIVLQLEQGHLRLSCRFSFALDGAAGFLARGNACHR